MTDCSRRPALLDQERFEGHGVFLFLVPRDDLQTRVWPHRLVATDRSGTVVYDKPIAGLTPPSTPATLERKTRRPQPHSACTS